MKRDLDLVRSILVYVEKADDEVDADEMVTDAYSPELVHYHIKLMAYQGLLDLAEDVRDMNGADVSLVVSGLTWAGQDYLDAIRDKKVWLKAKKAIREAAGSTTFEVVKQAASMAALTLIKDNLGI